LIVSHCGSKCDGLYDQRTSTSYYDGVRCLAFVEGLGAVGDHPGIGLWCITADVYPMYPLSEQRRRYRLQEYWEGPQLLYVCRDTTPLSTRWEPVLGTYPAPAVCLASAKPLVVCSVPQSVSGGEFLSLSPEVSGLVLDAAFNLKVARWRGDAHDLPRGHTCLELALMLASTFNDLRSASAVCKAWRAGLFHVHFTGAMRVVLQVAEAHEDVRVPGPHEYFKLCLRHYARPMDDGLAITHDPMFRRCAWGVSIDELQLSAPTGWRPAHGNDWTGEPVGGMLRKLAPAFYAFARELFPDARLPWSQNLDRDGMSTHGDGVRTRWTSLLDDRCGSARFDGDAHLLARCEPNGTPRLFTFAGEQLTSDAHLEPAFRVLESRLAAKSSGLRVILTGMRHGWSCSYRPQRGQALCEFCAEYGLGGGCRQCKEKRGWSTLKAQETLKFQVVGDVPVPHVELCISGMCVPWFRTTDDADRNVKFLREMLAGCTAAEDVGLSSDEEISDLADDCASDSPLEESDGAEGEESAEGEDAGVDDGHASA